MNFGRRHRFILFFIGWLGMVWTAMAAMPNITLTGVMSSGGTTNAYIEGALYREGEVLPNGFRIIEIRTEGIVVSESSGDNAYFVPVGGTGAEVEKVDREIGDQQIKKTTQEQGHVSFVSTSDSEEKKKTEFNFENGAKAVLAVALILLGILISLIGNIWFLVACFKAGIWWGLGALFIPLVELFFLFSHWEDAKRPFLMTLVGALMAYGGIFMMPELFSSF